MIYSKNKDESLDECRWGELPVFMEVCVNRKRFNLNKNFASDAWAEMSLNELKRTRKNLNQSKWVQMSLNKPKWVSSLADREIEAYPVTPPPPTPPYPP